MADQWHNETISLYDEFPQMVRIARRYVHDHAAAEEVVQEAFMRFNRAFGRSVVRNPKAYLRMAVRNVAVSWIRREIRSEDRLPLQQPSPSSVEEVCVLQSEFAAVRRQCETLPQRQRQVLHLRYWHDMCEAEIARHMGISAGAVKTHAHRARQTLRDALMEEVA